MVLQGVKLTIPPLGVGYANRPKKAQNGGICGVFPIYGRAGGACYVRVLYMASHPRAPRTLGTAAGLSRTLWRPGPGIGGRVLKDVPPAPQGFVLEGEGALGANSEQVAVGAHCEIAREAVTSGWKGG